MQLLPGTIILPNKSDEILHEIAKQPVEQAAGIEMSPVIKFAPTRDFAPVPAKTRFLRLQMNNEVDQEKLCAIAEMCGMQAIRAAGGLIEYLEKNRIVNQLEDSTEINFSRVGLLPISNVLQVDIDSLKSLHVFHNEVHPSQMGIGPAKEGLSVFGLLDHTKSVVGKKLLRLWMLQPLTNIEELERRYNAIEVFLNPEFAHIGAELCPALRKVKDVPKILSRIKSIRSSVGDWISLHNSINAFQRILELCGQCDLDVPIDILQSISETVTPDLIRIAFLLREIFDLEASKASSRLIVQSGVDNTLDEKRASYEGFPDYLTEVATTTLETYFDFDIALTVEFVPQIGYMIQTPNDSSVARVSALDGMRFIFNTDQHACWKNSYMIELDESVGDIHGAITDMEAAIAREVEARVLALAPNLIAASDAVAQLDCLLSFATAAFELRMVRPALTDDCCFDVEEGRHPLQELVVDRFIPNDISLGRDGPNGSMHIITGANFSGKSVFLKQVALIAYMAQTGSFVPAKRARLGIVDRIFTRIHSRESCTLSKSTFMIDLQQVSYMLQNLTAKSMLIVDEFGKGTNSSDGIALLGSMIRYLLRNPEGVSCPRTLIATHFNELFNVRGVLPSGSEAERAGLKLFHMSVHEGVDSLATHSRVAFLYRIVPGMAEASLGFHCALQAGLNDNIVTRAQIVSKKLHSNLPINAVECRPPLDARVQSGLMDLIRDYDPDVDEVDGLLRAIRNLCRIDQ